MAPLHNAHHLSNNPPLLPIPFNGARDVSSPFGSASRPLPRQERRGRDLTEWGRTDGQTDRVDSGQTAAVRPLPGEPPLPFPVTEMELINPVYSGNILQRRATDGRR